MTENTTASGAADATPAVSFSDRTIEIFTAIHGTASDAVMDSVRLASAQAFTEL